MKPQLLRVPITRALCFGSMKDWNRAASAVRAAADAGGIRATGLLGLALAKGGDRQGAIALHARLLDIAKSNPAAYFDASVVSFGLSDLETSFTELRRAVDADVLGVAVVLAQPPGGQAAQTLHLALVDGLEGLAEGGRGAGLHLTDHQHPTVAEDEVHLARGAPPVAVDQLHALAHQVPGGPPMNDRAA